MIKVSVMYPNTPGARFNHEYYRDKHMPLVKARLGDACKYYTVDKGLAGGTPGAPATYVGMCHIFCDSIEAFQAGFGPHAQEIMGDIPNYTDQNSGDPDQRSRSGLSDVNAAISGSIVATPEACWVMTASDSVLVYRRSVTGAAVNGLAWVSQF